MLASVSLSWEPVHAPRKYLTLTDCPAARTHTHSWARTPRHFWNAGKKYLMCTLANKLRFIEQVRGGQSAQGPRSLSSLFASSQAAVQIDCIFACWCVCCCCFCFYIALPLLLNGFSIKPHLNGERAALWSVSTLGRLGFLHHLALIQETNLSLSLSFLLRWTIGCKCGAGIAEVRRARLKRHVKVQAQCGTWNTFQGEFANEILFIEWNLLLY